MQPALAPSHGFLARLLLASVALIAAAVWVGAGSSEADTAAIQANADAGVPADDMHAGVYGAATDDGFSRSSVVKIYEKDGDVWEPACDATVIHRAPGTYTYDLLVTADCVTDRCSVHGPTVLQRACEFYAESGATPRWKNLMAAKVVDLTKNFAILRADIPLDLDAIFDDQKK